MMNDAKKMLEDRKNAAVVEKSDNTELKASHNARFLQDVKHRAYLGSGQQMNERIQSKKHTLTKDDDSE
jgi:hypothetical protein